MTIIKRVQASYNENNGTVLPGYLSSVGFAGGMRPTLGYTLGSQADVRYEAAKQGWLTDFPNFNQMFTQLRSNRFKATAQVLPLNGLILDFNAERDFTENKLENFSVDNLEYIPKNSSILGNFGMSTILIKTAFNFSKDSENLNFEKFRSNRIIIAKRLSQKNIFPFLGNDEEGYPIGFGKNQQSVLLHSFVSAYSGSDPKK